MSDVARDAPRTGVLVMAHGTPADPSELADFFTRIRGGRAPTPEQLAELRRRYDAIGGTSPLNARTRAQVAALASRLEVRAPNRYVVRYGAKHTSPFIEDSVKALAAAGVEEVVGVVLTPHRSSVGSCQYLDRARAALAEDAPSARFVAIAEWYETPGFAELQAERVGEALAHVADPARAVVIFTAHSVPQRVVDEGDPYPVQVRASAEAVARVAGLAANGVSWEVAWQSASPTPQPWLGPELRDRLRSLGTRGAASSVVVCPIGFVADHLEVLYDLDIDARRVAVEAGLGFERTASLNDDPRFIEVLAQVVDEASRGA